MTKNRLGCALAVVTLSVVPLAGCDAAGDKLSSADACADLIQMSLTELRQVRENVQNPDDVAQELRAAAERFQDKAADIDDADVKQAAEDYAEQMKRLAQKAESGEMPDLDAVARANQDLAGACGS
jgi:hypothetical protein